MGIFLLVVSLLMIILALCVHFGKRDRARIREDMPSPFEQSKAETDQQEKLTNAFYEASADLYNCTGAYKANGFHHIELKTRVVIGADMFESKGKGYHVDKGQLSRPICYRRDGGLGHWDVVILQESHTKFVVHATSPYGGFRLIYTTLQGAINCANGIDCDRGPFGAPDDREVVSAHGAFNVVRDIHGDRHTSFTVHAHDTTVIQLVYSNDMHTAADLEVIEESITGAVYQWYLNDDPKDFVKDLIKIVRNTHVGGEADMVIQKYIPSGMRAFKHKKIEIEEARLTPSYLRTLIIAEARKLAVDSATVSVVEAARVLLRREEDYLTTLETGHSDAKEIYKRATERGNRYVNCD